jgi:hypothetical protein
VTVGSSLSLRSMVRIGSSLSVYGLARIGSSLSVLDYLALGATLSLRSFARLGATLSVYGLARLGSFCLSSTSSTLAQRCRFVVTLLLDPRCLSTACHVWDHPSLYLTSFT